MHQQRLTTQDGAALMTALILLLVLTVIGISSLGSSAMEEKMAGNAKSREIAFQAAEAALRAGERHIADTPGLHEVVFYNGGVDDSNREADNDGDTCTNGYCLPREHDEDYDPADVMCERWALAGSCSNNNLAVWTTAGRHRSYDGAASLLGVNTAPKYIIEFMAYSPAEGESSVCDTNGDGVNDTPSGTDEWPYCPSDPRLYRVTALGYGPADKAKVMLQSTYLQSP